MKLMSARTYRRLCKKDPTFWLPEEVWGPRWKLIGWQWAGRTYKHYSSAVRRARTRKPQDPKGGKP